jgi:hypothetical protein
MNENPASVPFHQRAKTLTHAPSNIAKDLQTIGSRDKKCDAVVAQNAYGFGKAFKGLQVKPGNIQPLELFFRIHVASLQTARDNR